MKLNLDKLRVSKNIPNEVLPYANTIIDETVEAILKDIEHLDNVSHTMSNGEWRTYVNKEEIKQLLKGEKDGR